MKHLKILTLFLTLSFMLQAQKYKNVIYNTSQEYLNKKENVEEIKSIKYRSWHNDLEVHYQNGIKEFVDINTVWGYQNTYGAVARWIPERRMFFYIRESKGIVAYIGEFKKTGSTPFNQIESNTRVISRNIFWGERHDPNEFPFFSKTLDSEPFAFSWEELKTQYADDACFIEKINAVKGLFKLSYEIDDKTKRLKINQLFKECHPIGKIN